MGDVGIKVSQEGFDVNTCADRELLFSSAFKTLKIAQEGAVSIAAGDPSVEITHGLGYKPLFLVYYKSGSDWVFVSWGDVDTTKLYLFSNGAAAYEYYYYIFQNQADSTVDQTNINLAGGSAGGSGDYGLKVSKPGSDIGDGNIDQAITSALQTQIIHRAGYGIVTSEDVTITHNLGYIPMHLAYRVLDGGAKMSVLFTPLYEYSYGTTTNIVLHNNKNDVVPNSRWTNWTYYYVIFKDPIL